MPDMLVRLYALPRIEAHERKLRRSGVIARRPRSAENRLLAAWVGKEFGPRWAKECRVALSHRPSTCFTALERGEFRGFACYDAACRNFFGPTGTAAGARGRGIGRLLLLKCLHAMRAQGYGYAIIGGVGPAAFYRKTVGAVTISGSDPGIYRRARASHSICPEPGT